MPTLLASLTLCVLVLFVTFSSSAQTNLSTQNKSSGRIDYAARDTSLDTLPRETFVPFIRRGNLILIEGSVNGKKMTMIFDTGAAGCLFSRTGLASLGINIPTNLPGSVIAGVGNKEQTQAWIMPVDLKLGSIERRQFPVHINDNQLGFPLLGVSFLQDFEYTINTDSNIIQFKLIDKSKNNVNAIQQTIPPTDSSKNISDNKNTAYLSTAKLFTYTNFLVLQLSLLLLVSLILQLTAAVTMFIQYHLPNIMAPSSLW